MLPGRPRDIGIAQAQLIRDLVRLQGRQALVVISVVRQLEAVACQQPGHLGILLDAQADEEKRGGDVFLFQDGGDGRAEMRVRAVVEGQGDLADGRVAFLEQRLVGVVVVYAFPVTLPFHGAEDFPQRDFTMRVERPGGEHDGGKGGEGDERQGSTDARGHGYHCT